MLIDVIHLHTAKITVMLTEQHAVNQNIRQIGWLHFAVSAHEVTVSSCIAFGKCSNRLHTLNSSGVASNVHIYFVGAHAEKLFLFYFVSQRYSTIYHRWDKKIKHES